MRALLVLPYAKWTLLTGVALLALSVVMPVDASETRVVPREVYPEPFEMERGDDALMGVTQVQLAFLGVLSELVFLQTAVAEPLLRSDSPEQADSVIRTELTTEPQTETASRTLSTDSAGHGLVAVRLLHGAEEVERVTRPLPSRGLSFAEVQELVQEATAAFVPHLVPVERPLAEAEIVQRSRREEVEQILSLEDRLDSRFLLTLWATEIRALRYKEDPGQGPYSDETEIVLSPFPVVAELIYFRSRSFGLLARMSVDFNSSTPFYEWRRDTSQDAQMVSAWDQTDNMILLPGVGLHYRSLGRVGIDLSFIYSLGTARVTARKDVSQYEWFEQQEKPEDFLAEGESIWFLYQMLSFQPGITVALTDRWALRAATSFSFDPRALADSTPYSDAAGLAFRYLQLGLARRF
ncbi:MAG: hypothetical protein EA428_04505 [Spirochaetaceae bacterium]|nr:MAG: hypothetical protein EA428_04505 [Spirochaetaceae bacterium]